MQNEVIVTSSNIASVGYNNEDLYIRFTNNSIYVYFGASEHFQNLVSAPSVTKYLNEYIKPHYKYEKLS